MKLPKFRAARAGTTGARFGISGSQWGVLVTLHRGEVEERRTALRLTDLGDRLIVRPPSVTGVVDRLQRMGLVARTPSSDDHRAKDVSLTSRPSREAANRLYQRIGFEPRDTNVYRFELEGRTGV